MDSHFHTSLLPLAVGSFTLGKLFNPVRLSFSHMKMVYRIIKLNS